MQSWFEGRFVVEGGLVVNCVFFQAAQVYTLHTQVARSTRYGF